MRGLYYQREVSRLIGISESQIRYWDRQGLISPLEKDKGRSYYDFQGLVAFRTVKELRRHGVSLRKLKKCVEKLQKILPQTGCPLSEARLRVINAELVCSKDNFTFNPEGQLLIDFETKVAAPLPLSVEKLEEMFFQALEDEAAGQWAAATEKYRAILRIRPDLVDALVNLGNLLHLTDGEGAAAELYRRALEINPDHVEANYNLGNLAEEEGDANGAIRLYQQALQEDPDFAEAHFNLAEVLEKVGNFKKAREHWRRYLELDPESDWAPHIRERLEEEW